MISQDTSAYGVDISYREGEWRGQKYETRSSTWRAGSGELGIWVRMHYVYPYPHVDDVIPLMAERKVLPYLDIPFQHGSPTVLKRMRRPGQVENTLARIRAWREICPDLTIRSTFIVGFPGETEAEFEELLAWLDEAQLDRVGAFKYSPVEGAAANASRRTCRRRSRKSAWRASCRSPRESAPRKLAAKVGQRCACWWMPSTAIPPSRAAKATRRRSTAWCASPRAANSRSASSPTSRSRDPAITISRRRSSARTDRALNLRPVAMAAGITSSRYCCGVTLSFDGACVLWATHQIQRGQHGDELAHARRSPCTRRSAPAASAAAGSKIHHR